MANGQSGGGGGTARTCSGLVAAPRAHRCIGDQAPGAQGQAASSCSAQEARGRHGVSERPRAGGGDLLGCWAIQTSLAGPVQPGGDQPTRRESSSVVLLIGPAAAAPAPWLLYLPCDSPVAASSACESVAAGSSDATPLLRVPQPLSAIVSSPFPTPSAGRPAWIKQPLHCSKAPGCRSGGGTAAGVRGGSTAAPCRRRSFPRPTAAARPLCCPSHQSCLLQCRPGVQEQLAEPRVPASFGTAHRTPWRQRIFAHQQHQLHLQQASIGSKPPAAMDQLKNVDWRGMVKTASQKVRGGGRQRRLLPLRWAALRLPRARLLGPRCRSPAAAAALPASLRTCSCISL